MDLCDWEKIGRPELLHLVYTSILEFTAKNSNTLPQASQTNEIVQIAKSLNTKELEIDEEVVRNCILYLHYQISPMTSLWGGIVAQEIVKFTGKFSPIR